MSQWIKIFNQKLKTSEYNQQDQIATLTQEFPIIYKKNVIIPRKI